MCSSAHGWAGLAAGGRGLGLRCRGSGAERAAGTHACCAGRGLQKSALRVRGANLRRPRASLQAGQGGVVPAGGSASTAPPACAPPHVKPRRAYAYTQHAAQAHLVELAGGDGEAGRGGAAGLHHQLIDGLPQLRLAHAGRQVAHAAGGGRARAQHGRCGRAGRASMPDAAAQPPDQPGRQATRMHRPQWHSSGIAVS